MSLAHRLQRAIAARNMTQSEVADAVGMSRQQLGKIVGGANPNPGILMVEKIAEAIGVSMAELYRDEDDDEGQPSP
jgi:transcriptional regulator with XRE-family HTH domain